MNTAEYLLLHIISRVTRRKDVTVVGHYPLNIRTDPKLPE